MASAVVHERITKAVVEALEQGTVPWSKPWHSSGRAFQNGATRHVYQGLNTVMLACAMRSTPWFYTLRQCHELGGRVKDEEFKAPATVTYFAKKHREKPKEGQDENYWLLRYYTVWNYDQCEGFDPPEAPPEVHFDPVERAEEIIALYQNKPQIIEGAGDRAAYSPTLDKVVMPSRGQFESVEQWYHTLFHELTHSTGHRTRLARGDLLGKGFGSEPYAKEELVADMGASFLCGEAGIDPPVESSASYIANWLEVLRNDKSLVYWAATGASRSTKFIVEEKGVVNGD